MVEVGNRAPAFALPSSSGALVKSSEFRGRKLIVYFYPRDFTSGCTREACEFRDVHPGLVEAGAAVVGISPDGPSRHAQFAETHALPFPLLSDSDQKVSKAYGVWQQKHMYGRMVWGVARTTFLVDEGGRIERVWANVRVEGHAEEVLEQVRTSEGTAAAVREAKARAAQAAQEAAARNAERIAQAKKKALKKRAIAAARRAAIDFDALQAKASGRPTPPEPRPKKGKQTSKGTASTKAKADTKAKASAKAKADTKTKTGTKAKASAKAKAGAEQSGAAKRASTKGKAAKSKPKTSAKAKPASAKKAAAKPKKVEKKSSGPKKRAAKAR